MDVITGSVGLDLCLKIFTMAYVTELSECIPLWRDRYRSLCSMYYQHVLEDYFGRMEDKKFKRNLRIDTIMGFVRLCNFNIPRGTRINWFNSVNGLMSRGVDCYLFGVRKKMRSPDHFVKFMVTHVDKHLDNRNTMTYMGCARVLQDAINDHLMWKARMYQLQTELDLNFGEL